MSKLRRPIEPIGTLDGSGLTDLGIIARQDPGKSAALRRMFERAKTTQAAVAHELGRSRAAVCCWLREEKEANWPKPDLMRRLMFVLGVDQRQIIDTWGVMATADPDVKNDLAQLLLNLKILLDSTDDRLERRVIIGDTLEEQVFIRLGIKAMDNVPAAEAWFNRVDKYREAHRLASGESAKRVNGHVVSWLKNPYEPSRPKHLSARPADKPADMSAPQPVVVASDLPISETQVVDSKDS